MDYAANQIWRMSSLNTWALLAAGNISGSYSNQFNQEVVFRLKTE